MPVRLRGGGGGGGGGRVSPLTLHRIAPRNKPQATSKTRGNPKLSHYFRRASFDSLVAKPRFPIVICCTHWQCRVQSSSSSSSPPPSLLLPFWTQLPLDFRETLWVAPTFICVHPSFFSGTFSKLTLFIFLMLVYRPLIYLASAKACLVSTPNKKKEKKRRKRKGGKLQSVFVLLV